MLPIIIVLIVIAVFFLFLYILYLKTFFNFPVWQKKSTYKLNVDDTHRPKLRAIRDNLQSAPFERVYIKNREGKQLAANYYHNRDNAPVGIIFHGYRGRAMSDSAGGFKIFCDLGMNILIPDHRAHGESQGRTITFGIKERYDCLDWVAYLNEKHGSPDIFLVGVSMGGATVLMASGEALPDNVKGIISDCAYSSPEVIIRKVIGNMGLSHKLFFPFVRLSGMVFGGFDVSSYDAMQAVSKSDIPILLIHGENDGFVPHSMALDIQKCCGCQLLSIPSADHGLSYIYDTEKYTETVNKFIKDLSKT